MNHSEDFTKNIKKRIPINTIYLCIKGAVQMCALLILTPYIIGYIGVERFGIWAILSVLTGYLGLLDFGIGESFTKYISEYYNTRNYSTLNKVVNVGFVLCAIFAVTIIGFGLFLLDPLVKLFNISPGLQSEATQVFFIGIILFGITNALSVFKAVQTGLQRMDVTSKLSIAFTLCIISGTVYVLRSGYGLIGLMVNQAFFTAVFSVVDVFVAFKLFRSLKLNPFMVDKRTFKDLLVFGSKIQVSKIASLVHFQTDKFLLAYFLNMQFVAFYEIAANLALKLRAIPLILTSAILPAVSGLDFIKDRRLLSKVYNRSMKYVVLVGFPLSFFTILFANPFITLWLGEGYEKSILSLQILFVGYAVNIMSGPGFFILNGIGKPNYSVISSIFGIVLNLIVSIILVIKIGFFGVVLGTSISMVLASVYFMLMFHRTMNISVIETAETILLKPFSASIITFLIINLLLNRVEKVGWVDLIGIGGLYFVIYILLLFIVRYFDDFDRYLISKYSFGILFKNKRENNESDIDLSRNNKDWI